ncbi:hypothetical protein DL93DRAFT_2228746 [Clavulina sp. PMI_390]|nr:hypothetical protein DL93DRAFT_2228746 [Clavulina sp. PMI_390]
MSELDAHAREQLKSLAVITSMCSYWRNVAIATPKLWTCIVITASIVKKGVEVGRSIISTFIRRSKTASIDIYICPPPDVLSFHKQFMAVYEPVIPHLQRCLSFCCDMLGNKSATLLFPLAGPMPRLSTLVLTGDSDINFSRPPITIFAQPSSLTALRVVTIFSVPIAPIPANMINHLTLTIKNTSHRWSGPLIASCTQITSLRLIGRENFQTFAPSHIALPKLKVLHHSYSPISPSLHAPALEEIHWTSASLSVSPSYGDACFPSVKKLCLDCPLPYYGQHPPRRRLKLPRLQEVVLDDAAEASSVLCALLVPHMLQSNVRASRSAKLAGLPYPTLRLVTLKATDEEDRVALLGVLIEVLELYQHTRLGYDENETFPAGENSFWSELKAVFSDRVFATNS